jgi:hypothetical protein
VLSVAFDLVIISVRDESPPSTAERKPPSLARLSSK